MLASLSPPILLDEWQAVPEVLGAVKRAVDDHDGAGRFLLTGSVRSEMIAESWSATGRVVRVAQWGLTERELTGDVAAASLFDRVAEHGLEDLRPSDDSVDLRGHVVLALRGSSPEVALQPSASLRRRWLGSYVDQLVLRDAALHDQGRDPTKLRRYLAALAANTAGVTEHKTIYDTAGTTRVTGVAYDGLLELLFVTEQIPAWHSNRLNRLTRSPKRYLTEPALLGPLLGIDERSALRIGDILGRLLDSFVVSQLRPEIEVARWQPRLHHLRQEGGAHEIDIVAEYPGGNVVAIEVKATSAPKPADGRHLGWLRDQLGDDFIAGIVFHTGPRVIRIDDRIAALPISCMGLTDAAVAAVVRGREDRASGTVFSGHLHRGGRQWERSLARGSCRTSPPSC